MKIHPKLLTLLMLVAALLPTSARAQAIGNLRAGLSAVRTARLAYSSLAESTRISVDSTARHGPSFLGALFGFLAGAVVALGVHREDKVVVLGAVGAVIGLVIGP